MATQSKLTALFHELALASEKALDGARDIFVDEDDDRPVRLVGYAGYRTAKDLRFRARVLLARPPKVRGTGSWAGFRAMLALYNSHEVADVALACETPFGTVEAVTDGEGYAEFAIATDRDLPETTTWETVQLSAPAREAAIEPVDVPILAPGNTSRWGVISDIDDTILETGATNFLKNWRRVLVHTAKERVAVPGAADLYRNIAICNEQPHRPFFYVSSSPWNLYPMLTEFKQLNGIPAGPMFLKDYGLDRDKFIHAGHGEHKSAAIDTIVEAYPAHKFLLIGDSGQRDISIYTEAVARHPDRFGAVLIRDVEELAGEPEKQAKLDKIRATDTPVFVDADFGEAFATLQTLGFEAPAEVAQAAVMPEEE